MQNSYLGRNSSSFTIDFKNVFLFKVFYGTVIPEKCEIRKLECLFSISNAIVGSEVRSGLSRALH
jgi:hypothetical protein